MEEFIKKAAGAFNLDTTQTTSAAQGVLTLMKEHNPSGFSVLGGRVDGLEALADKESGTGVAAGMLGSLLGGSGATTKAVASLAASGLSTDNIQPFIGMLMDYLRDKAGLSDIEKLVGSVPAIAEMFKS